MALRNAEPLTLRPMGLTDATDGSTAFEGAMAVLQNLVPSPSTPSQWVPRPAAAQTTNFAGFTTPAGVTALLVIGTRAYGFVSSARFAGKDEPFCYDLSTGAFITLSNVVTGNCPTTQSTSGDWTPPTMAMVGSKLVMTHPGYSGANFVGWIDLRSFTSASITGSTHTSTLLDTLSTNVLAAGWQVGDKIAGTDIPANTFITAIAANGLSLTLSQAATGTHAGNIYTVTSGTPAAPLYGAGQVNGVALASVPVAVAQYNNRAWYAVANGLQFSDAGSALQQTNATQQLTLGDNTAVTALSGLPLGSQLVGGVVQSLIAFKGSALLYQVTGDAATANLATSAINGSVGTLAPNTIAATPKGLAYIAPDGLRILGAEAQVSDPIGAEGHGVCVPFINAINPSRMCAAYNQNVYRVSVQNGAKNGQPVEEYWFHFNKGAWSGPHSFPAALIQPYAGATTNTFIMAASGVNAALWQSDPVPKAASSYTENGQVLSWAFQPSLLPDNARMAENCVIESAVGLGLPSAASVNVLFTDEQGAQLAQTSISVGAMGASIWNAFNWGAAVWGSSILAYQQYAINWPNELVFKQGSIRFTGTSAAGVIVGNVFLRYQILGFLGV